MSNTRMGSGIFVTATRYWIRNMIVPISRKFLVSKIQDPKFIRGWILDSEHDSSPLVVNF